MLELPRDAVVAIVRRALEEDLPWGDVTTNAVIPADLKARATIEARQPGIVAGMLVAETAFALVDPAVCFTRLRQDGESFGKGDRLAVVEGRARSLLSGERVALNFLQRMSAIATTTQQYVDAVAGLKAGIIDTRKTTPGLRLLEKYAVTVGGGANHRFSLSDGVLIKDNHIAAVQREGYGIGEAVRRARASAPHTIRVEVEVETIDQLREALDAGADMVLLDNMSPDLLREAVRLVAGRAVTEASGGITLETVRAVAETGVDLISVGALTHSVRALDLAMEFELG